MEKEIRSLLGLRAKAICHALSTIENFHSPINLLFEILCEPIFFLDDNIHKLINEKIRFFIGLGDISQDLVSFDSALGAVSLLFSTSSIVRLFGAETLRLVEQDHNRIPIIPKLFEQVEEYLKQTTPFKVSWETTSPENLLMLAENKAVLWNGIAHYFSLLNARQIQLDQHAILLKKICADIKQSRENLTEKLSIIHVAFGALKNAVWPLLGIDSAHLVQILKDKLTIELDHQELTAASNFIADIESFCLNSALPYTALILSYHQLYQQSSCPFVRQESCSRLLNPSLYKSQSVCIDLHKNKSIMSTIFAVMQVQDSELSHLREAAASVIKLLLSNILVCVIGKHAAASIPTRSVSTPQVAFSASLAEPFVYFFYSMDFSDRLVIDILLSLYNQVMYLNIKIPSASRWKVSDLWAPPVSWSTLLDRINYMIVENVRYLTAKSLCDGIWMDDNTLQYLWSFLANRACPLNQSIVRHYERLLSKQTTGERILQMAVFTMSPQVFLENTTQTIKTLPVGVAVWNKEYIGNLFESFSKSLDYIRSCHDEELQDLLPMTDVISAFGDVLKRSNEIGEKTTPDWPGTPNGVFSFAKSLIDVYSEKQFPSSQEWTNNLLIPCLQANYIAPSDRSNRKPFAQAVSKSFLMHKQAKDDASAALIMRLSQAYRLKFPDIYSVVVELASELERSSASLKGRPAAPMVAERTPVEQAKSVEEPKPNEQSKFVEQPKHSIPDESKSEEKKDQTQAQKIETTSADLRSVQDIKPTITDLGSSHELKLMMTLLGMDLKTGKLQETISLRDTKLLYSSSREYFDTFYPMLVEESKHEMLREFEQRGPRLEIFIDSVIKENPLYVTARGKVYKFDSYISLGDIFCLQRSETSREFVLCSVDTYETHDAIEFLFKVSDEESRRSLFRQDMYKSRWIAYRIFRGGTKLRECRVFSNLHKCSFISTVLASRASRKSRSDLLLIKDKIVKSLEFGHSFDQRFNENQKLAIVAAVRFDGITLIQGPPGTGKTKTLVGIVDALRRTKSKEKILVCASSNGAVDEIVVRLNNELPKSSQGTVRAIRYGMKDQVGTAALPFFIDNLCSQHMEKESIDSSNLPPLDAIRQEILDLNARIKSKEALLDEKLKKSHSASTEIIEFKAAIELLKSKKNEQNLKLESITRGSSRQPERRKDKALVRKNILSAATIVCTTLGCCIHEELRELCDFRYVIVDEAAQALEISTLQTLLYKVQKLILVGDPNQLPATILSPALKAKNYDKSLFARLMERQHPFYFLDVQHRMHPDISRIPSKFFYKSALKDAEIVRSSAWKRPFHSSRLPPFTFIDVSQVKMEDTKEDRPSPVNLKEAEVVLCLITYLCSMDPSLKAKDGIGIISPYRGQVNLIKDQLRKQKPDISSIEVNTVDGFQGREKTVIIISCVRTSDERTIGFLSDVRRINVSLTRGKCGCYVIADSVALSKNGTWKDIIEYLKTKEQIARIREPFQDFFADLESAVRASASSQKQKHQSRSNTDSRASLTVHEPADSEDEIDCDALATQRRSDYYRSDSISGGKRAEASYRAPTSLEKRKPIDQDETTSEESSKRPRVSDSVLDGDDSNDLTLINSGPVPDSRKKPNREAPQHGERPDPKRPARTDVGQQSGSAALQEKRSVLESGKGSGNLPPPAPRETKPPHDSSRVSVPMPRQERSTGASAGVIAGGWKPIPQELLGPDAKPNQNTTKQETQGAAVARGWQPAHHLFSNPPTSKE
eukprot:TRINITY_DN4885_c0_g1_i1.p1 TRINITY_DN4885_c0_g1~~TRINITY_DN4885_c0_g1_i1.p1  ORF type:complete len:1741 (+),score=313.68 TRINITY_DN4885_c0_g1_i1:317-5539(+)